MFDFKNPKNWPEDFDKENGCYINICSRCDSEFMGHKRRHLCRECNPPEIKKEQPKTQKEYDKELAQKLIELYDSEYAKAYYSDSDKPKPKITFSSNNKNFVTFDVEEDGDVPF